MRIASFPLTAFRRTRDSVHRAGVRRRLEAVAWGTATETNVSLDDPCVADVIEDLTAGLPPDSPAVQRLVAVFMNSGAIDRAIERLEVKPIQHRAGAARVLGALRFYEAVPRVAPLLASRERPVSDAATRALGRIGGTQSATALLFAVHRRGVSRRLVAELARSAPDLFLEAALDAPLRPGVRPAVALAAGLRRRRTATIPLMRMVVRGTRRERVISCRALGWIGASTAIPTITTALNDRDWKIRMSAAKALGALRARPSLPELRYLAADRNARVREAARLAVRRIEADGS